MEEEGGSRPSSFQEESLESRDNPFLPGGDLSREAEDLLSKATIVRDKFYLHQQQRQPGSPSAAADPSSDPSRPAAPRSPKEVADGALLHNSKHPAAVEERIIAPTSASAVGSEARPDPHPRENGKAGSDGVSSPDGVRVEVEGAAEGGKGAGSDSDEGEKDKPKRRAKCCVVM